MAITLGAALALLVVDQYALEPYLARRAVLAKDMASVTQKLTETQRLFTNRRKVAEAWRNLLGHGLKTDPSDAEGQALHALRDWAQATKVDLQSLKPDRSVPAGDFQQIRFQAAGNGTTATLAALLWRIENSELPLRINDVRLTSRKEGSDDLAFQVSVSTVLFSPAPEPKQTAPRPASKEAAL